MSDPPPRRKRQFIVDFEGSSLARLGEGLPVEPVLETSSGEVEDLSASRLPGDGQWRVSFKLSPGEDEPTDMRLHLELRGKRLTETWNYVWSDDDRE
jgi:glucans biosynthesis protein